MSTHKVYISTSGSKYEKQMRRAFSKSIARLIMDSNRPVSFTVETPQEKDPVSWVPYGPSGYKTVTMHFGLPVRTREIKP